MHQSFLASVAFRGQPLYYLSEEEESYILLCSVCHALQLPPHSTPGQLSADTTFAEYWIQRAVQLPGEAHQQLRYALPVNYWLGWLPTVAVPAAGSHPFGHTLDALLELLFAHWLEKSAANDHSVITFYFEQQPLRVDLASGTALYSAPDLNQLSGNGLHSFLASEAAQNSLRTLKTKLAGVPYESLSVAESLFWDQIIFRRQGNAQGQQDVWLHGFVAYCFAGWLGNPAFLRWLYDLQTHLLLTRQALLLPDDEAKGHYLVQQAQTLL